MKLTAWLTLFFLTVFLTKIAIQSEKSNADRAIATEKSKRANIR